MDQTSSVDAESQIDPNDERNGDFQHLEDRIDKIENLEAEEARKEAEAMAQAEKDEQLIE